MLKFCLRSVSRSFQLIFSSFGFLATLLKRPVAANVWNPAPRPRSSVPFRTRRLQPDQESLCCCLFARVYMRGKRRSRLSRLSTLPIPPLPLSLRSMFVFPLSLSLSLSLSATASATEVALPGDAGVASAQAYQRITLAGQLESWRGGRPGKHRRRYGAPVPCLSATPPAGRGGGRGGDDGETSLVGGSGKAREIAAGGAGAREGNEAAEPEDEQEREERGLVVSGPRAAVVPAAGPPAPDGGVILFSARRRQRLYNLHVYVVQPVDEVVPRGCFLRGLVGVRACFVVVWCSWRLFCGWSVVELFVSGFGTYGVCVVVLLFTPRSI